MAAVTKSRIDIVISATTKGIDKSVKTTTTGIIKGFKKAQLGVKAFNKEIDKGNNIFKALKSNVTKLVGAYAGFALIKNVISTFADFDDKMRQVKAVSNATASEFKALTDIAMKMGAETRYSAVQSAEGLKMLTMAGFSATDAVSALPSVLSLAAAAAIDLGTAADITTNMLSSYNMEVKELASLNDIMVKAMTSSNSTIGQLGEAFKYVAPVAKSFDIDIKELVSTMGMLHDKGIKGSLAGTALKASLQRLINPMGRARQELDKINERIGGSGLEIMKANGKFVGFISIIKQLEAAGMTAKESLTLFRAEAGPSMAALLEVGSDAMQKYRNEFENIDGISQKLAEDMESGIGGAIRALKSAFEGLKIAIGDAFKKEIFAAIKRGQTYLKELLITVKRLRNDGTLDKWGNNAVYALGLFADALKLVLGFMFKFPEAILALMAIGTLASVIGNITFLVGALNAAFLKMSGVGILAGLASLRTALNAVAVQGTLASAGLLGLAGGAALLGIAAIYKLTQEIIKMNAVLNENSRRSDEALKASEKFKHAKDIEIKSKQELLRLSDQERQAYTKNIRAASSYYAELEKAAVLGRDKNVWFLPFQSKAGAENERRAIELTSVTKKYRTALLEAGQAGREIANMASDDVFNRLEGIHKISVAEIDTAMDTTRALKRELDKRASDAKRLHAELLSLQAQLISQETQREDDLRAIRQRSMSDTEKQADLTKQATDKIKESQNILLKGSENLTKADYERAKSLAEQGKSIAKSLKDQDDALKLTATAWDALDEVVKKQEQSKQNELKKTLEEIKKIGAELEKIENEKTINVIAVTAPAMQKLEKLKKELNSLKDKVIKVTIKRKTVESHKAGGSVGAGKISGYGGGDKVDALLERGEFIVRKEVVKRLGESFFYGLNSMTKPLKYMFGGVAGKKKKPPGVFSGPDKNAIYNINNPQIYNTLGQVSSNLTQLSGIKSASNMVGLFKTAVKMRTGGSITDAMTGIRSERDFIEKSYQGQIDFARELGEIRIAESLEMEKLELEQLATDLELLLIELELEYQSSLNDIEDTYNDLNLSAQEKLSQTKADLLDRKDDAKKDHLDKTNALRRDLIRLEEKYKSQEQTAKPIQGWLETNITRKAKIGLPAIDKDIRLKRDEIANEKQAYDTEMSAIESKEIKSNKEYNRSVTFAERKKELHSENESKKYDFGVIKGNKTTDLEAQKTSMSAKFDRLKITNETEKEIFMLQIQMNRDLREMQKEYASSISRSSGDAGGGAISLRHWLNKGGRVGKYADGGSVFDRLQNPFITQGGKQIDDVPAMLTRGEFVLKKGAVKKYGLSFLHSLNQLKFIPQFAKGGLVGMKRKIELALNPNAPFSSGGVTYNINNQSFHNHLKNKTDSFSYQGKDSARSMISDFSAGAVRLQRGGSISQATYDLVQTKRRVIDDYNKQIGFAKQAGNQELAYLLEQERYELEMLASELELTLKEIEIEYEFQKEDLLQNYTYDKETLTLEHKDKVAQLVAEKLAVEQLYKQQKSDYYAGIKDAEASLKEDSGRYFSGFTQYGVGIRPVFKNKEVMSAVDRQAAVAAKNAQVMDLRKQYETMESDYILNRRKAVSEISTEKKRYPFDMKKLDNTFENNNFQLDSSLRRDVQDVTKENYGDAKEIRLESNKEKKDVSLEMKKEVHSLEVELAKELADLEKEIAEASRTSENKQQATTTARTNIRHWLNKGGFIDYAGNEKGKDVVPSMLTAGEYVIKEAIVKKFGKSFFDSINNLQMPVSKFADGGIVGGNNSFSNDSINKYNGSVTFEIAKQNLTMNSSADTAKTLVKELRKMGLVTV